MMYLREFTEEGTWRRVRVEDLRSAHCKASPQRNVVYIVSPSKLSIPAYGSVTVNTGVGLPTSSAASATSVIVKGDLGNDVFVLVADNRESPTCPLIVTLRNVSSATRSIEPLVPLAAILDVTWLKEGCCNPQPHTPFTAPSHPSVLSCV
uniref:AlNc14C654G12338 protein n=1 Tax=Albugo laibachii Nc14 TaxID=890382 RepID=F0X1M6_9STRA|nr:AlNc14C654G12338 [Albugo laibachii Nc14]|eukprot:CCA27722.1 AlNc14C654G12338 [Albugo laibachii Nc14]